MLTTIVILMIISFSVLFWYSYTGDSLDGMVTDYWYYGILIMLVILTIICFSVSFWYSHTYCQYRETPSSIQSLLTVRRHDLGSAIDPLTPNTKSVCNSIVSKSGIYSTIPANAIALVNWRPLTVRLSGYLGGIYTARDGVFDMNKGITMALSQGSRAFVFDIDYLDASPCDPVIMYRDDSGIKRSLNTGSIAGACKTLAANAFVSNYDPVLIILFMRRIPPGKKQRNNYLSGIASSLVALSKNHLGMNEQGNFHNCKSENILFTSPITNFQKKFIVLTNYDTSSIKQAGNPKDNLDFWTNARLWLDESGKSAAIGNVTQSVPSGLIAYGKVGSSNQLLQVPSTNQAAYLTMNSSTFLIALGPPVYNYSNKEMDFLLNTLGIQCVPIDVLGLAASPEHFKTITLNYKSPIKLLDGSSTNPKDILSFWSNSGWSRKNIIIEGFANPIPGFIIPPSIVPKKPPPSTNSNGGLVMIG